MLGSAGFCTCMVRWQLEWFSTLNRIDLLLIYFDGSKFSKQNILVGFNRTSYFEVVLFVHSKSTFSPLLRFYLIPCVTRGSTRGVY